MLFNSGEFLVFFPIVMLVYYIVPQKMKNIWLLIASYFFYMCWNAKYALLLLTSTLVTYVGGILIERIKNTKKSGHDKKVQKGLVLVIVLSINLIILFWYKYINFALELVNSIAGWFKMELNVPAFDIILPVGISFYIFQAIGYLVDVYRDDIYAEKNIVRYALFVSFFPQLVAGPIERSKNLLKQLESTKKFDPQVAREGLLAMLWGYFLKMVIADRCAILVNTVYSEYDLYKGFQLAIANVLFAVQIYCDFMGYSIIAKGAAKVLGIDLMSNFEQPYFAVSVKEFWRRWHISLSSWFRDYVYIPLGGSRCSKIKKYRNLFLTFMISGLWHGASLTFVFWGIIHGVYQIIEDIMSPFINRIVRRLNIDLNLFSWKLFRIIKTFILVDIAWVFFRADTVESAWKIIVCSFDISNLGLVLNDGIYKLGLDTRNMNILLGALFVLVLSSYLKEKGVCLKEWIKKQNILFRYSLYYGAVCLILISLDITGQEFIYFQF